MNNKIVITGGRGFIGVNLATLLYKSRLIVIVDNLERASPTGWEAGNFEFVQASILDHAAVTAAFQGASAVVHLAAYGSVVESVTDPIMNFSTNVQGTFNVLNAAITAGIHRVVFASTGGALIGDAPPPVDEDSLPKPISPYGASKLCGEAYCHAFAKSRGLDVVCLRFGNVYGPHSAHKKGAVTMFIKALMCDEPIVIYGDGSASRDYIHVEDLCSGIQAGLDTPSIGGDVFHLATGRETTILELAHILREVAGKPNHTIEFRPARCGEVMRNFARYDKAARVLGYAPKISLKEGLTKTYRWFEDNRDVVLDAMTSDS